jgi:23S rRNA (guanosine2251-2'-O)-methyltransferase
MARAIERLRGLGLWIVGLDGSAERSIFGHELLAEPVALVVGGEGAGLARLVAERCDTLVRIPMVGATESLNASIATAIAVFEVARVRGWV